MSVRRAGACETVGTFVAAFAHACAPNGGSLGGHPQHPFVNGSALALCRSSSHVSERERSGDG